jgi:hypothetical protein
MHHLVRHIENSLPDLNRKFGSSLPSAMMYGPAVRRKMMLAD